MNGHPMGRDASIYLVDEDASFRASAESFFSRASIGCIAFEVGRSFAQTIPLNSPGCLVLDLESPVESGIDFLRSLIFCADFTMPVILLSRGADVALAVRCMKLGAFNFLQRPVSLSTLLPIVRDAFVEDARRRDEWCTYKLACDQLSSLNDVERQVLELTCQGISEPQICQRLEMAAAAVSRVLTRSVSKAKANNIAQLMGIAKAAKFSFAPLDYGSPADGPVDCQINRERLAA